MFNKFAGTLNILAKNPICRKRGLNILCLLRKSTTSLEKDMASATAAAAAETNKEDVTVCSRAYQIEMLEESLKRNVIVAVCFFLRSSLL
jgi:hypothetical protein